MSENKNKPVLDEKTLAKLLEAAYVLQEHNREMRALELSLELKRDQVEAEERAASVAKRTQKAQPSESAAPPDYTLTLAKIVETQHHIQVRQLELENATALVAERVVEMARAGGAAIGIVDGKNVRYRAVAGQMTLPKDTAVPLEKSLCIPCLKTSQVFRCGDVNPEFLLDVDECRRRGIASMIAVPVFHDGGVAGGLELYYSAANAFTEQDVHTCQLMAGLITEALVRDEELTWKKSLASERAAMLDALEKLKPNLAALVGPAAREAAAKQATSTSRSPQTCRKCGHAIAGEEQFCGQCGSPRTADSELPNMQSKVALLWEMQEAQKNEAPTDAELTEHAAETPHASPPAHSPENTSAGSLDEQISQMFAESHVPLGDQDDFAKSLAQLEAADGTSGIANELEAPREIPHEVSQEVSEPETPAEVEGEMDQEPAPESVALEKATRPANWSSAASARAFLEQFASSKRSSALIRFWNTRRGDIYLAIAVVLVLCVIRWGIWSSHSVGATAANAAHHKSSDVDLSLFDRMLISLGLAEAPDSPEDMGNPNVQVWIDTHTGLYYCQGNDFYGKTPNGKFATQRDAQLDQYQPAYRKACN